MIKQSVKKSKVCTILRRYFVKSSRIVICDVRNGEDKEYRVTLQPDGRAACTCDGNAVYRKQCYHIKHVKSVEDARKERMAQEAEQANEQKLADIRRFTQDAYEQLAATKHVEHADHCAYCGKLCKGGICGYCAA